MFDVQMDTKNDVLMVTFDPQTLGLNAIQAISMASARWIIPSPCWQSILARLVALCDSGVL